MDFILDDIEICEVVGYFEDEWVYDVESGDENQTFIANNILVHNSLYISFKPVLDALNFDTTNSDDTLQFILHMYRTFIKDMYTSFLNDYAAIYGVENLHDFEFETVSKNGLFMEKKNYLLNIVWKDGIFHDDMSYFYPKGIEIVKSSTPLFVREKIWDFVKYIFKDTANINIRNILKMIKNLKSLYVIENIDNIASTTSLSNYNTKVIDDNTTFDVVKGAHFSVKAAAFHNFLLNKNSKYKVKYDLLKDGKVKYIYCNHPINDRFAYSRGFLPVEIMEAENVKVDHDTQFAKTMLTIMNRFLLALNLPLVNKRLTVLNSIFGNLQLSKEEQEELTTREDVDKISFLINEDEYIYHLDDDTWDLVSDVEVTSEFKKYLTKSEMSALKKKHNFIYI